MADAGGRNGVVVEAMRILVVCKDTHGNYRRFQGRIDRDPKIRSKTFPGIARAMAEQWG